MLNTLSQIVSIAWFVVLPVLILIALGYALQRRLGLDMPTLTRLNFYVVVPAMVFFAVVDSELSLGRAAAVVGFCLVFMSLLGGLTYLAAGARGVPVSDRRALVMSAIFYNSGNYGLPVQELAFRASGQSAAAVGLQIVVVLTQNITSFTAGVVLAAGDRLAGQRRRERLWQAGREVLRFPPIYALSAGVLILLIRPHLDGQAADLAAPFWDVVRYGKEGFVVVALVTLGAQLALVKPGEARDPVRLSVALRLLLAPALGLALIQLVGLVVPIDPLMAQVLLISTAMPTSVNCLLICMEFDNRPGFVARNVLYSTMISPITLAVVIAMARAGWATG